MLAFKQLCGKLENCRMVCSPTPTDIKNPTCSGIAEQDLITGVEFIEPQRRRLGEECNSYMGKRKG
jgi:hypothetical protein